MLPLTMLTKKQKHVLEVIRRHKDMYGYPPTLRELAKSINLTSPQGALKHLQALEKKGYIRRSSDARGITVLIGPEEKPIDVIEVPLVGNIAGGLPILAEENIEEHVPVPTTLLKKTKKAFLLRVKGKSMSGDGIYDGDLVLVRPQSTADNGDIVVALVNENREATVKRYFAKENFIILQPSNKEFSPLVYERGKKPLIQGKVIGIMRRIR